jgi:hypothetical protein
MVRCPTRVDARVAHGAGRERGCTASPARLCYCAAAAAGQTGAQKRRDEREAVPGARADEPLPTRVGDAHLPSGNVSVDAREDAGVEVDVGADAGVGAHGCADASGYVHGCEHGDVGSLQFLEVAVEAVLVGPEEGELDDDCASVAAGADANESGGMNSHAYVHTRAVHADDAHRDQDVVALIPLWI